DLRNEAVQLVFSGVSHARDVRDDGPMCAVFHQSEHLRVIKNGRIQADPRQRHQVFSCSLERLNPNTYEDHMSRQRCGLTCMQSDSPPPSEQKHSHRSRLVSTSVRIAVSARIRRFQSFTTSTLM